MSRVAPLVIKLGGAALDDRDAGREAAADIAAVALETPTIVVHGGGAAVDAHFARLGVVPEKRDGIRVTPAEQIDDVVAVLAGMMNVRLVGLLRRAGCCAVGLSLGAGGLAEARAVSDLGFDPGRVGTITGGDPRLIEVLLDAGFVPVVSSIGLDDGGRPLNINADDAAAALARLVGARELRLLTDVAGVHDDTGRLQPCLSASRVAALRADGVIAGGMVPKVRAALTAAIGGIPVTIARWGACAGTGTSIAPEPLRGTDP